MIYTSRHLSMPLKTVSRFWRLVLKLQWLFIDWFIPFLPSIHNIFMPPPPTLVTLVTIFHFIWFSSISNICSWVLQLYFHIWERLWSGRQWLGQYRHLHLWPCQYLSGKFSLGGGGIWGEFCFGYFFLQSNNAAAMLICDFIFFVITTLLRGKSC